MKKFLLVGAILFAGTPLLSDANPVVVTEQCCKADTVLGFKIRGNESGKQFSLRTQEYLNYTESNKRFKKTSLALKREKIQDIKAKAKAEKKEQKFKSASDKLDLQIAEAKQKNQ
jgi:hypothetical protein